MSWEDLVSTALVGTDRRPYGADLLADAAVEVVRRRAGRRPAAPGHEADVAPEEEREAVGRAAARRLVRILAGQYIRVLPEWLAAAAASGRRAPSYALPDLLERGRRDRSMRAHLGVLAGERGRWLARRNPDWAYLLEEPTGEPGGQVWELGKAGDRRAHLALLRATDPARARRLLQETWEVETPDDRADFVGVLADGLTMDDEPFLEAALDDRRREVRQQAANLLTRLPGSRLARRMAERLSRVIGTDQVNPPEECDKSMERDGIRAKPPRGIGEKAWWLQQVIARAPLARWGDPDDVVRRRIPDWEDEVRAGWVRGAVLQQDAAWARAMFAWDPIADLLAVLPPGERQHLAADFVKNREMDSQLIMVLGGVPAPWHDTLAAAVLRKIVQVAATQPWNLGELGRLAAERIDPALCDLPVLARPDPNVQEVAALLRFRADMLEELE
ncbi:DUF5691 domain-containing protein [Nonomuraea sediminis]|uniref:DUF5691 domain-containing protein n=1 Tax=Nonomuraea sediminis TaxID=2835864 RepID=UPI0027E13A81|nr:DUF5691 domain-containing protein [Nonomuraea sediminis]